MQIFRNVPASKFARPPDRPYRCEILLQGSRGFYVRAYRALLPPHAPDMLTVRIQAKDRQDEAARYLERALHVGSCQTQNNDAAANQSEFRQYCHATESR